MGGGVSHLTFWWRTNLPLNFVEKSFFWHIHCGADALVINLILWSRTTLEKNTKVIENFRYRTNFPTWQFLSLFNIQHKTKNNETNPGYLRPTRSQGLFWFAFNTLKIPQTWNLSSTFAIILLQKDQFWFLFMLLTSFSKVCKKN